MFSFTNLQYAETPRGVVAWGVICNNGYIVGEFRQEPYAAVVTKFGHIVSARQFQLVAQGLGIDITAFAERLLCAAENYARN